MGDQPVTVAILNEALARFGRRLDVRFDGIDRRLDGVDVRLDGIDHRLDSVDDRIAAIERRLDGMDARFVAIEVRIESVNLFNHVNLGNPDAEVGVPGNANPNAGRINSTAFGGSDLQRNFQFGVKFRF